ncbi:MAG: GGDEF domain-containing protein [Clostridia bacterium]|nr:GGDEF domain-containing protein [Clostridia bacterium]
MLRKKIAVLMASIDREYQQDFASGLASAGSKLGMDVCIFNSQGHMNVAISTSEVGESMIYDLPDLNDFDGIISMPATMGSDVALKKVYEVLAPMKGKPHISIDVPQEGAVTILFNDRISMEEMTEHLISEHNARKIAFVSGPLNSSVATERVEACRNVMKRHGLELEDRMIFDGQWTRIGGRNAAEKLLDLGGELPDAIMCGNDDMALSVIECLNEHGIRVPKDIAVTGFDALREAIMRGLTTICRPIDRSARKAIEILNSWIEGEEPKEKTVILSTIPIFGDSCGCTQSMEHINEKLRALGSERWNMEATLTRVSMFSGTMAGVGDETEAHEKIHDFVKNWNIREFYLCVDPSICRDVKSASGGFDYPDEMLLLYGVRSGKQYDFQMIPTFDLTPVLQEMRKNAVCLVFCPLYYRDRNLGYVAMDLGNGTGSALYPVLMLLNGALMSLYLQTNIKRSAATIERMAIEDIMTGMLNRRGYMERAPVLLEQARQQGRVFILLSADMDHMKDINDQYGHLSGDEAICRMGRALRCLEKHGMTPVHISGDEFLAYGTVDDPEEAGNMTAYVNEELKRINEEDPWICNISASFGVHAAVPQKEDNIDIFMTMADRAMYADKNKRKYGRRKDDIKPDPSL